jgi:hypothetical protein
MVVLALEMVLARVWVLAQVWVLARVSESALGLVLKVPMVQHNRRVKSHKQKEITIIFLISLEPLHHLGKYLSV